jgi:hypothetical protein
MCQAFEQITIGDSRGGRPLSLYMFRQKLLGDFGKGGRALVSGPLSGRICGLFRRGARDLSPQSSVEPFAGVRRPTHEARGSAPTPPLLH